LLADITALALYRLNSQGAGSEALAGTYHVTASGETTWFDYARYVIGLAASRGANLRCPLERIEPVTTHAYPVAAARPKNSRLDTGKLRKTFNVCPPDWRYHVARMIEELPLP
jgi:dTDP-4-dehydrorhamnose reductase